MISSWSQTMPGVKLSSAEAEYCGLTKAAKESLFVQSLAEELVYHLSVILESDAASAIAAAEKKGALRFKHIAIRLLFLKELAVKQQIFLKKVTSEDNIADILTKPLDRSKFERNLRLVPGIDMSKQTNSLVDETVKTVAL